MQPQHLIDSENLATQFVVVSRFALPEWWQTYETLSNFVVSVGVAWLCVIAGLAWLCVAVPGAPCGAHQPCLRRPQVLTRVTRGGERGQPLGADL